MNIGRKGNFMIDGQDEPKADVGIVCPDCDNGKVECPECNGTGGSGLKGDCIVCGMTGEVSCETCNGTGKVTISAGGYRDLQEANEIDRKYEEQRDR